MSSLGVVPRALPITGTWTLPFAAYLVLLSNRVVYHRIQNKKYIGESVAPTAEQTVEGDPDSLSVATRAHANFMENVPLGFVLAAIAELNGANKKGLNAVLAVLLLARIAHVEFGLRSKAAMGVGRPIGFYGSQGILTALAAYSAYLVKGYWGY